MDKPGVNYQSQPLRASPRPFTPEEKEVFLRELRAIPNVTRAARCIGRTVSGLRAHRGLDRAFAEAWDEAIEDGIDALEGEVHRRAFEGVDKPVTFQGEITDTYKEYSDNLAMFLLKAHRPDKYRERTDLNITNNADLAAAITAGRRRIASGAVIEGEAKLVDDDDCADLL